MFAQLAATAALLASTATAAAHAQALPSRSPDMETMSVTVRTDDLNLRTEAGAAVLMQRIRDAAVLVCGRPREIRASTETAHNEACVSSAINRAAVEAVLALRLPNGRITVLAEASR